MVTCPIRAQVLYQMLAITILHQMFSVLNERRIGLFTIDLIYNHFWFKASNLFGIVEMDLLPIFCVY